MAFVTDLIRLVGLEPVQRISVLVRVDGDGAHPEFAGGPERTDSDLPAVRHQHFGDHIHPYNSVIQ